MSEPRHISECVEEWLTQYAAINAIHPPTPRGPATVAAEHANTPEEKTA